MNDTNNNELPEDSGKEYLDEMKKLSNLSDVELLRRLKSGQLRDLLAKLELGLLSHQEHAIIARLLADNGLVMPNGYPGDDATPNKKAPEGNTEVPKPVQEELPQFSDDDDEEALSQ